jgi:hypothetical protein
MTDLKTDNKKTKRKRDTSYRCTTVFKENITDPELGTIIFEILRDNMHWVEAIRSKEGFTRKGQHYRMGSLPLVDQIIRRSILSLTNIPYTITEIFVNYYEHGQMWCQNHNHSGSHQVVLSFGASRTLNIGKRKFIMTNGSGCLFGSSTHGVPKEENVKDGRISIAIFMLPTERMKTHKPVHKRRNKIDWVEK